MKLASAGSRSPKNRNRVLDLLRQHGGLALTDIGARTGLSRATVSALISDLRSRHLVIQEDPPPSYLARPGRPPEWVALNNSLAVGVGLMVTSEVIQVGIGNIGLELLVERTLHPDFSIDSEPQAALHLAADTVKEALASIKKSGQEVIGGVIGVDVPIDREQGTLAFYSGGRLENWKGSDPAALLSRLVGFPVMLENDANLAAWAEAVAGSVKGTRHVLYMLADVGIGCGLVLNGRLYHGVAGGAGEIAHMLVPQRLQREGFQRAPGPCYCGRRGCLTTLVSVPRMVGEVQDGLRHPWASGADPDAFDAPGLGLDTKLDMIIDLARNGDAISARVLGDVGRQIGLGLANVCNTLNPSHVVVGGRRTRAGRIFMNPLKEEVLNHTVALPGAPVEVVESRWQERGQLIGAIALGIRAENDLLSERLWTMANR